MSNEDRRDGIRPFMLTMPLRASLLTTTGLILAGIVVLYVDTYNMVPPSLPGYPGDAFFPRAILIFTAIWGIVILVRGIVLPQAAATVYQEAPVLSVHWLEFISIIVLVLAYAALLEPVGFEITTVVFMMMLLIPRLMALPGTKLARAVVHAFALSSVAMLTLYAGLGPALKIGLPLKFLPVYMQ